MKYGMKYLPMSNEMFDEISAMQNEILNEIPTNERWNIWWNKCVPWRMKYSMKYLPMSNEISAMENEIFNEITAMENKMLNEIPANEQWNIWWNKCHGEWNIQWNTYQWAMKWSIK